VSERPGGAYYPYPTREGGERFAGGGWEGVTVRDAGEVWGMFGGAS